MEKRIVNETVIALISDSTPVITDAGAALDSIMTAQYTLGASAIAIAKSALPEAFFILSTGMAGEVLQKFITYHTRFAVYGDFSAYTSKPLKDFIYESNKGTDIFFAASQEEALQRLSAGS